MNIRYKILEILILLVSIVLIESYVMYQINYKAANNTMEYKNIQQLEFQMNPDLFLQKYEFEQRRYLITKGKIEKKDYNQYLSITDSVRSDFCRFPIPEKWIDKISYEDSFQAKRNYPEKRAHEGCDLMYQQDKEEEVPVLSVSSGIVTKMGWLPLGGYRIGVLSENGFYFYYAHLSSYAKDIKIGSSVKAGEFLGFMGNTGYGPEGTKGKFPVHLHFGIYYYPEQKEKSINPYYFLKSVE